MCGRYVLNSTPAEVAAVFGVDVRDQFPPRYNIAPTQPIAAIVLNEQRHKSYALMRWGFIPEWMGEEKGRPMINARSETVSHKPSFKNAFKRRRCLVPANGFYEWAGKAGARQPHFIQPTTKGVFAFAGIWETVLSANGSEVDTVAILTVSAGLSMQTLHAREPIVIWPEKFDDWLRIDERDTKELTPLLKPQSAAYWAAHPVSIDVNSPSRDGPSLIVPVELDNFKTDLFE